MFPRLIRTVRTIARVVDALFDRLARGWAAHVKLARQNPSYAAAVTGAVAMLVLGNPADLLAAVIATLLATFGALSREDDQDPWAAGG